MKKKVKLNALDINNIVERHNLDATLFNDNYLYINSINGQRSTWLEPLIATHHLERYHVISVYFNGYDKYIYVEGKRKNEDGTTSGTKSKSHPNYFTAELKDVYEALTYVRITEELHY